MVVNIEQLVSEIAEAFPNVKIESRSELDFKEIRIIGECGVLHLYPNDLPYFMSMYPTHESYKDFVLTNIAKNLIKL